MVVRYQNGIKKTNRFLMNNFKKKYINFQEIKKIDFQEEIVKKK